MKGEKATNVKKSEGTFMHFQKGSGFGLLICFLIVL